MPPRKRAREEDALVQPPAEEQVYVRPPDESFQCSVCTEVFSDASMLECGHSFCQACIVMALRAKRECPNCRAAQPPRKRVENIPKPNHALRALADGLEVHCRWGLRPGGAAGWEPDPSLCPATMRRDQKAQHEASCPFRVVQCGHKDSGGAHRQCEHRCRARDLAEHEAECELRPVSCRHEGCEAKPSQNRAAEHAEGCAHRPVECPNEGCSVRVCQSGLEAHRASCAHEIVQCGYAGCGARMKRQQLEAHEKEQVWQHLRLEQGARQALEQQQKQTATEVASLKDQLANEVASLKAQLERIASGGGSGAGPARVLHVPRDHATVEAAVNAARPGERVVLAAGLYKEHLRIKKRVEIVGVAGGRAVLEWEGDNNAIFVSTDGALSLSNVAVRHRGGGPGDVYGALAVLGGGSAQAEGCDFSSAAGCGIYCQDEGSELRLKDCTVHDCREGGVVITAKSKGVVEGCTARGNRMDGIGVQEGASAELRHNTCTANGEYGITIVQDEGEDPVSAVVEGNRLEGNTLGGLGISERCRARVQLSGNTGNVRFV